MKKTIGILLGLTAVTIAAILVYNRRNRNADHSDQLSQVSDEGYETAHDVLFPNKFKKEKGLRFGPVIPGN